MLIKAFKTNKGNGRKIQMAQFSNSHLVHLLDDLTEMRTSLEIKLPLKEDSSNFIKINWGLCDIEVIDI